MVLYSLAMPPDSTCIPPPEVPAVLPVMVQLVSMTVPLTSRPAPTVAEPPVIVRPARLAVTLLSTWNTRLCPPPLIVRPATGPVIMVVKAVLLSSSGLPASVMDGTLDANVIWTPANSLARVTAPGRVRDPAVTTSEAWKAPMSMVLPRIKPR